ncbi:hypothetical protein ACWEQL_26160 [Kitasatospora sp. NPDC004240]
MGLAGGSTATEGSGETVGVAAGVDGGGDDGAGAAEDGALRTRAARWR